MKRRQILQITGATIAALDFNQIAVEHQALRCAKVLAQSAPRKHALLIGINQHTGSSKWEVQAQVIAICVVSIGLTIPQQFQIQNEFTAFQPIVPPLWSFNRTRNQGFQALKFLNLELLTIPISRLYLSCKTTADERCQHYGRLKPSLRFQR